MADLMIDYISSLDGFGGAEGWPGLWGMGGPEYFDFLGEEANQEYHVLMGSTTYRLFAGFVESEEFGPHDPLTTRRKFVFSQTLEAPLTWANTTLVAEEAAEAVRSMKEGDTSLRTLGSPSLCRSLLAAGLVDRYRVVVFPVVNGATGYDRMYDGWPDVTLELVDSRTLDGRLQLLEYVPTVLDTPPG